MLWMIFKQLRLNHRLKSRKAFNWASDDDAPLSNLHLQIADKPSNIQLTANRRRKRSLRKLYLSFQYMLGLSKAK